MKQQTFEEFWNAHEDSPQSRENDLWGLNCEFIELDNPKNWQSKDKSQADKTEISRRALAREAGMRCSYPQKMDFTIRCIRRAFQRLPKEKWCLSWSAGKDSTALSCVITEVIGEKIHHVMSNTRLEYPETIRNMHALKSALVAKGVPVTVAYPDKRPHEVWSEDGIPLFSKEIASKYRQWIATGNDNHLKHVAAELHEPLRRLRDAGIMLTDKCCDELKKKPMRKVHKAHGFLGSFTGVRASESQARKLAFLQRGALYNSVRNRQWICNPIVHWSEDDVMRCLKEHGVTMEIPTNAEGRSGCVNCAFGCHIATKKKQQNSLQALKENNPVMWAKTMDEWKFREACRVAGIEVE